MFHDVVHYCSLRASMLSGYAGRSLQGPYRLSGPDVFWQRPSMDPHDKQQQAIGVQDKTIIDALARSAQAQQMIESDVASGFETVAVQNLRNTVGPDFE